jgi:hypothetical protein
VLHLLAGAAAAPVPVPVPVPATVFGHVLVETPVVCPIGPLWTAVYTIQYISTSIVLDCEEVPDDSASTQ